MPIVRTSRGCFQSASLFFKHSRAMGGGSNPFIFHIRFKNILNQVTVSIAPSPISGSLIDGRESHPIMISFGKFSSLEKGSPYFFSDAATAFMAITAPEASSELADTTAGIFMSDGNFLYTARCRL